MRDEYDFSRAERGKFYRPDASLNVPVYLEPEVLDYLVEKARNKGVDLSVLVNDLLKKGISLIEGVK